MFHGIWSLFEWLRVLFDVLFSALLYPSELDSKVQTADLSEKVVIVTGANTGVGKETAKFLWQRGATVVFACRSRDKAEKAIEEILEPVDGDGEERLKIILLDLTSFRSVRSFAREFRETFSRLDILVLNAGLLGAPKIITQDGFEALFQVHHLSHFLLTALLTDILLKSGPSRVVVVSSKLMGLGVFEEKNLNWETGGYSGTAAYANSKLMNVLFTKELARRLPADITTVNACHPGNVMTDVTRNLNQTLVSWQERFLFWMFRSPFEGASTQIRLSASPDIGGVTGKVFCNYDQEMTLTDEANDAINARKLWDISLRLTQISPSEVPDLLL
mmetsp:Transcript_9145/g.12296  ORF Transcript_9145/g.12296 Transcript_9145/m.12296 type:complete len:332 (-) Transcript_9145:74-1069(-)|eukprot:CAMPEP_0201488382 /NCGR_PEP_ID=MMETSP0151_2-20130828/17924_1 /ASSEMBLY_ACC=CAM_ASM_000257 /TAXON_ID=200890 /ORGANISM="Paramoeba atlantica, Strain 621/1 / CCAP 1560/9" /LENGTH=331 /DNA_ID=CAMNT_0047873657 /DNA_START=93 /DNA_END=1088 /DNA_ORIENTATION=+